MEQRHGGRRGMCCLTKNLQTVVGIQVAQDHHRTALGMWPPAPEYDPVTTGTLGSASWWHPKFPAEIWWVLTTPIFHVKWCVVNETLMRLPGRQLKL